MAAVMVGWAVAPLPTLLVFVGLSGLHFGRGDLRPGERQDGSTVAVRATTPLLLVHAAGVASLVAALAGAEATAVAGLLDGLRWLLVPWGLAVTCYGLGLRPFGWGKRARARDAGDAAEVGAIAAAAVVLPPLLGFALWLFAMGGTRTQDEEGHTISHGIVPLFAALAYRAMAMHQGATSLPLLGPARDPRLPLEPAVKSLDRWQARTRAAARAA